MSQTCRIAVGGLPALFASPGATVAGGLAVGGAVARTGHEEMSRSLGELVEQFQNLGIQVREHFGPSDPPRPLISIMLSHREDLRLSSTQVQALERLRGEFQKQAIRAEADLRVAEMDLGQLLSAEPADMSAVEPKIREIEKRRADLRLARVRTVGRGRALLSADQREKLRALLAQQPPAMRVFPTPPPP